jgi:hypothetical protein
MHGRASSSQVAKRPLFLSLRCQAFCNPAPDMSKKVEEFQHLLAPWSGLDV